MVSRGGGKGLAGGSLAERVCGLKRFSRKKKNARSQVSLAGVEKLLHKVSPATPIDSAGPGVKDILH